MEQRKIMYVLNGKKINIDAPFTIDGVTYPNIRDPLTRASLGVVEIEDPIYPDPELFFWTENEDGSLTITEKPEEMVARAKLGKAAVEAQRYLDSTDYLFSVDRYNKLVANEPERAADVAAKREEARECIRLNKEQQVIL